MLKFETVDDSNDDGVHFSLSISGDWLDWIVAGSVISIILSAVVYG
jgi:phosphopantetheinyl transferase